MGNGSAKKTLVVSLGIVGLVSILTVLGACTRAAPATMAVAPQEKKPLERVIFRYSWTFGTGSAFAFAGIEKGFWVDEGLDVTLKESAGIPNSQLVAAGVEPFGGNGLSTTISAVQSGATIKMVFVNQALSAGAIMSPADRPIRHPKELEGKTLVAGAGTTALSTFPAVMQTAGAEASKVNLQTTGWSLLASTVMLGKGDAWLDYWTSTPSFEATFGKKLSYLKYTDYGVNVMGDGLIVSDKLIAENPDLVRRFVRGYAKSFQYTLDHPEETAEIFVRRVPSAGFTKELLLAQIKLFNELTFSQNTKGKPAGWMAKEDWEALQDIGLKYLGLKKTLPVDSYYTNQFIP